MKSAPGKKETHAALVIGHPGHELRAYKFIKEYQPDVFILTDGSGSNNSSRVSQTIAILESLGSKYQDIFVPYSDVEIYRFILDQNLEAISAIRAAIQQQVEKNGYNFMIGDALEGFNPTHDLCRYLINSIVKEAGRKNAANPMHNYAFDLDAPPNRMAAGDKSNNFLLQLDSVDLDDKLAAAVNYPELKFEVDKAISHFGKEAFMVELFVEQSHPGVIRNWSTPEPAYEFHGRQRVSSGIYSEVITFEKHMKPIADLLLGV